MTPRQRFQAMMDKRPADRALYDLAGTGQTQVDSPELTARLRELLGIEGEYTGWYDRYDERILNALSIDTRRVGALLSPESPLTREHNGVRYDVWGVGRAFSGQYWDIVDYPLRDADEAALRAFPWPDAGRIDRAVITRCAERAKRLYEETDYVIVAEHPCFGVMEIGCWMMGYDEYFYRMAAEPEFIHAFSERFLQYQNDVIELYYGALGDYIHVTTSGDDFGTQTGPFLSKAMFDAMTVPYMKRRIALTKQATGAYFFHHTCGSVFSLIPSLIEMGVDILNPIQPLAADMEPQRLKAAYGDKLTFWGGVDTQHLLTEGAPGDVRRAVEQLIADMRGTGFVLSSAHTLQSDVKAENVIAMFRE